MIRTLEWQDQVDRVLVAQHIYKTDQSLNQVLPVALRTQGFQPLRLVQQLFLLLRQLHGRYIEHGELSPHTIHMTADLTAIRVQDILRAQHIRSTQDPPMDQSEEATIESRAIDVYAAGCLAYYILSQGRSPFADGNKRGWRVHAHA